MMNMNTFVNIYLDTRINDICNNKGNVDVFDWKSLNFTNVS